MPYKDYCSHLIYTPTDNQSFEEVDSNAGLGQSWEYKGVKNESYYLPFSDSCFDNVLCTEVLEHTSNPILLLNEIHRVLKKGGKLILTAPFNSLTHFSPHYYYSGFHSNFYLEILEELDMKIVELKTNGDYFTYFIQESNRLESVFNNHSSYKLSWLEKLLIKKIRGILLNGHKKNNSSEKLLHFGSFVLGVKNG